MKENDVLDEIVNDTIEKIDDLPFGITDDELKSQEVIEEIIEEGENDENTIE